MKKWNVWIMGYYHECVGQVEAETLEEAQKLADDHPNIAIPSLCHQCNLDLSDVEEITVEETNDQ